MRYINMKKAQSMSLNVIIVAALVVLVLIVLSVIFIRSMGNTTEVTTSCLAQGGKCANSCSDVIDVGEGVYTPRPDLKCGDDKTCCIKISN